LTIEQLLQPFQRFGVRLGLESSDQLLKNLGNPQQRVPIIHVAGSNGKGSVCAYLSAILTAAGYRVGRYTSPHLVHWGERICVNDQAIAPDVLETVLHQVIAAIRPEDCQPTQFEVITAAAWVYFAQQPVDIAVMEVGLGGRLDATNVCDRPLVTIITSLSREHWQRLGPTLADIAGEKAGILKPECPAVIAPLPPEAASVVHRRLAALNCTAVYPLPARDLGNGWAEYRGIEEEEVMLETNGTLVEGIVQLESCIRYPLPLLGAVQLQNSTLAIAAVQLLRQQGWKITDEAIASGMGKTRWAGRLQWLDWQGQRILVDGAHNPASAAVLRQFVDSLTPSNPATAEQRLRGGVEITQPIHWVMGMLSTKDHADIFQALLRPGDRLSLVPVPDHSSADPAQLAALAQSLRPDLAACQVYPDVIPALKAAIAPLGLDFGSRDASVPPDQKVFTPAHRHNCPSTTHQGSLAGRAEPPSIAQVVLCGSLYLVGHFLSLLDAAREKGG